MLDKSIPYAEVWMTRPREIPVDKFSMPDGFSLVFYQEGDQQAWAEIETVVGEFDVAGDALAYFKRTFAPYPEELEKRMLFITTETGEKVGPLQLGGKRQKLVFVTHWFIGWRSNQSIKEKGCQSHLRRRCFRFYKIWRRMIRLPYTHRLGAMSLFECMRNSALKFRIKT